MMCRWSINDIDNWTFWQKAFTRRKTSYHVVIFCVTQRDTKYDYMVTRFASSEYNTQQFAPVVGEFHLCQTVALTHV